MNQVEQPVLVGVELADHPLEVEQRQQSLPPTPREDHTDEANVVEEKVRALEKLLAASNAEVAALKQQEPSATQQNFQGLKRLVEALLSSAQFELTQEDQLQACQC